MQKAQNHNQKKTTLYKERDEKKREEFKNQLEKIPEADRVYVDESGINEYLYRNMARSNIGEKVLGQVSGKRFARESFIAGKVQSKILAPFCYQGTCNTELFNTYLEKILLPEMKKGQVIIMDNATFHKSQETRRLVERAGCKILFLPPYSPDLNPIEKFWNQFKGFVRKCIKHFHTLSEAIDHSFRKICYDQK